jgi:hypothetical protein
MSGSGKEPFSAWELSQKVLDWRGQMHRQIDGMTEEEVLGRDLKELAGELEERWRVEVPVLRRDKMERRTEETLLDSTLALRTTFYVPFDGHPAVFNMRPSKDDLHHLRRKDVQSRASESSLFGLDKRDLQDRAIHRNPSNLTRSWSRGKRFESARRLFILPLPQRGGDALAMVPDADRE